MACDFYDFDSEASHLAEIEDEDYLCEVHSYTLNFRQPQVTIRLGRKTIYSQKMI